MNHKKIKYRRSKSFSLIIFLFLILFLISFNNSNFLEKNIKIEKTLYFTAEEVEEELDENINNQLNDIDFSKLESLVNNLDDSTKQLFSNNSFLALVKKFINGDNNDLYSNFLTFAINIVCSYFN